MGEMKKVAFQEPTIINHHHTKHSGPGNLLRVFLHFIVYTYVQ